MNLSRQLTVNGQVVSLIQDKVQLSLFGPGRAMFEVESTAEPKGMVELHIGYETGKLVPYFLGVIEAKAKAGNKWFLTCRELLGALEYDAPLSIRFATMSQILTEYTKLGIEFVVPDKEYAKTPVPRFCHEGSGLSALRQLGKVFGIDDYICQQKSDGTVFAGSWNDSLWSVVPVSLPKQVFTYTSATKARLMAVPKLRPGIQLNDLYVTEVLLNNSTMELSWSSTLSNAQ